MCVVKIETISFKCFHNPEPISNFSLIFAMFTKQKAFIFLFNSASPASAWAKPGFD